MKVSAIVPVRDGAAFLGAALDSLRVQTRQPDEIVVVDDGSTDGSAAVAGTRPGVRLVANPGRGAGAARNAGAEAASGDFLAFLDADDLARPERIEHQLTGSDGCDIGFAAVRNFSEHGGGRVVSDPLPTTLVVRREAFLQTGGFDPQLSGGELFDWLDRCRARGMRWRVLDAVLVDRRVHGANLTLSGDGVRRSYALAAAKAIARRRAAAGE